MVSEVCIPFACAFSGKLASEESGILILQSMAVTIQSKMLLHLRMSPTRWKLSRRHMARMHWKAIGPPFLHLLVAPAPMTNGTGGRTLPLSDDREMIGSGWLKLVNTNLDSDSQNCTHCSGGTRSLIAEYSKQWNDSDISFGNGVADYSTMLRTSKFCLAPCESNLHYAFHFENSFHCRRP